MILKHKSTAWLLVGLQAAFSVFFMRALAASIGLPPLELAGGPSFYGSLFMLQAGITLALLLCTLWKFEWTALLLLAVIHAVCPIMFFTDLTRNPYYTQIALLNIWIGFLWLGWLWDAGKDGRLAFPKTALNIPLLAFFGVATLSWGVSFLGHSKSMYPSMFAEGLRNWIFLLVNGLGVYFIAVTIDEKWRSRFIWLTFAVGGVAAAYGLMQFYGIEKIWQKTLTPFGNRPVSTFGNPNFLSSYLLLLVPLLIAPLFSPKKPGSRGLLIGLLLLMVAGIVSTMTRSTWVGLLTALVLLPVSPPVRDMIVKNRKTLAVLAAALAVGGILWPKSGPGYSSPWKRIAEIRQVKDKEGYQPLHQRILIWSSSFQMVREHLILGKGWGQFELFYPYYQGRMMFHSVLKSYRTHANNCHNEVFEIWTQTGALGLGIYIWLWIVMIAFGFHYAREFSAVAPEKSILVWALTAGSVGMFADNFFGNVSIHFTIPAFLFWWQAGLLFGVPRANNADRAHPAEWFSLPVRNHIHISILCALGAGVLAVCVWNFRREFQEIHYFRGFKISKMNNMLEPARQELDKAWKWFPSEVNSNYEMANTYARLAQQSQSGGLLPQADVMKKKSIWAYREALKANAGYDEIFFNLAAIQNQMGWLENSHPAFEVETPWGERVPFGGDAAPGAIYHYSRALAINPVSMDAYSFLGNAYLQNHAKYRAEGLALFEQAVRFFPRNKEFWVNLGFLRIQEGNFDAAYQCIARAVNIDPSYEYARRNLALLMNKLGRKNDPLERALMDLSKINLLIDRRQWTELSNLCRQLLAVLPDNFQLRFVLANAHFELRQYDQAVGHYLEALRLEPDNVNAMNNMALAHRALGQNAEARKIYEKLATTVAFGDAAKKALAELPQ